jgi:hypothetical protein
MKTKNALLLPLPLPLGYKIYTPTQALKMKNITKDQTREFLNICVYVYFCAFLL